MNQSEFFNEADVALKNHLSFARFVSRTEFLFDTPAYADAWFEAEIVNAVALGDWENQGSPADWNDTWSKVFMNDATEVISLLKIAVKAAFELRAPENPGASRQ